MSEKNDYIIEMHGIQKSFGGVKALRNIDLQVKRGSCHALLGENGAGKSTLMKVLTGIIAKDSGKILLNGEEVQIQSLRHAEELRHRHRSAGAVLYQLFYGGRKTSSMAKSLHVLCLC